MPRVNPGEFGLTEAAIEEIRARDQKQADLFIRVVAGSLAALWLAFTVLIYVHSARRAPLFGLVTAPVLAGLGAVIAGLPIALLGGLVSWIVYPPHPKSAALERYEAATAGIRICDVCVLALAARGRRPLVPREDRGDFRRTERREVSPRAISCEQEGSEGAIEAQ
jgi:hypothetical protein